MADHVSQVNLLCQKYNKSKPNYFFQGGWQCFATLDWLDVHVCSNNYYRTKKDAKEDCAEKLYYILKNKLECQVYIKPRNDLYIIVDGDQRVDCWRWLAEDYVNWESNVYVNVYSNTTTVEVPCSKKIYKCHVPSNRDSADAKILIDIGRLTFKHFPIDIVLVSSDHILTQIADNQAFFIGNREVLVKSAENLGKFKELMLQYN